ALIYLTSNLRKTQVLEACLDFFTVESLRKIITGYCEHYISNKKVVSTKDATLEYLVKCFIGKISCDKDKTLMMQALSLAMCTHNATIEIAWVGRSAAFLHSKKIFDDDDIVALMRHYQKHHSALSIHHEVFVTLRDLLPAERAQQVT